MQVTEADYNNGQAGDEEEGIQFRPSPNFKNMKKFLKSRSSNAESSPDRSSRNTTPTPEHKIINNLTELKSEVKAVVQPPLPPYPPPPDSPLKIKIKQEKEDVEDEKEEENGISEDSSESIQEDQPQTEVTKEDQPAKTMCKEWLRGDCTRPVCRYTHEIIVSQLRGVFTFCWNYQNAACTYPNCKFVHANVFEEAEFYRSGFLPQQARAHLRRAPPTEESRAAGFANSNGPLINHSGVDKAVPIISTVPASNLAARPADADFRVSRSISPLKREWPDQFSGSPSDLEPKERVGKVCKNCEVVEFRVQYRKKMIDECIQAKEELNAKMNILNKKNNKLSSVLLTLMKPSLAPQGGGVPKMAGDKVINGEKEKMLLDQLAHYVGSNNILNPVVSDDNVKNLLGGLMAKLLYRSPEQIQTADTSREA